MRTKTKGKIQIVLGVIFLIIAIVIVPLMTKAYLFGDVGDRFMNATWERAANTTIASPGDRAGFIMTDVASERGDKLALMSLIFVCDAILILMSLYVLVEGIYHIRSKED